MLFSGLRTKFGLNFEGSEMENDEQIWYAYCPSHNKSYTYNINHVMTNKNMLKIMKIWANFGASSQWIFQFFKQTEHLTLQELKSINHEITSSSFRRKAIISKSGMDRTNGSLTSSGFKSNTNCKHNFMLLKLNSAQHEGQLVVLLGEMCYQYLRCILGTHLMR